MQLLRNPIFNYEFVSRYPIECVRFEGVVPAAWFKGRIVHPLHEHFYAFKLPTAKPLTKTSHGPNNEEEYRVDTIYLEEHDLIRVQLRPVLADDDLRGFVVEQPVIPGIARVLGRESSRVPEYFYYPNFRLCSTRGYLLLRRDPPEPPYQSDLWRIKSVEHAYELCVKEVHTFNFATKPEDLKGIFQALVASANALLLHKRRPTPQSPPSSRCPPTRACTLRATPSGSTTARGLWTTRTLWRPWARPRPASRAVARSARAAATGPRAARARATTRREGG